MKRLFRILFWLLSVLLLVFIIFYFWASSGNLKEEQYTEVLHYPVRVLKPKDSSLVVVSYNIGYLSGMTNNLPVEKPKKLFDDNAVKVIDALKDLSPDFIALQEIDYASSRSYQIDQHRLIQSLGYPFGAKSVNWDKNYVPFPYFPIKTHFGRIVSGQSVLSRFPIKDQKRIVLKGDPKSPFYYRAFYLDRLAQVAEIQVQDEVLYLINVHLEAFDQETRVRQMETVRDLYLSYASDAPVILLGDFNSDPREEGDNISLLLELEGLETIALDRSNPEGTYDTETTTQRLDYIFYNKAFIEGLEGRVLQEFGQASDHFPILMKFNLKSNNHGSIEHE